MLQPQVLADHEAVSERAAAWLVERLLEQPDALLCLATGATPMRTYQLLAARGTAEPKLFDRLRLLNLDEWGGLAGDDPASCEAHLRSSLITPLNLAERYVGFDGQAADPEAECRRIRDWLGRNGPIDVCVLGLGLNGHLGFNEPAEYLEPHAHVAQLSKASLSHAMVQRSAAPPTYGLTLGMADLLHARHILLLVTGGAKRPTMERLLSGRLTTEFPASLLALHGDVLLLCDESACSRLPASGV